MGAPTAETESDTLPQEVTPSKSPITEVDCSELPAETIVEIRTAAEAYRFTITAASHRVGNTICSVAIQTADSELLALLRKNDRQSNWVSRTMKLDDHITISNGRESRSIGPITSIKVFS